MVSPALTERVRAVATRLRFQPNSAARSLRARKSSLVGVLVGTEPCTLVAELVAGIDAGLKSRGQALVLTHCRGDSGHEQLELDRLNALGTIGVIAIDTTLADSDRAAFPVVAMPLEGIRNFGSSGNGFELGESAARLLLQRSQPPASAPSAPGQPIDSEGQSSYENASALSESYSGSIFHSAVVLPGTKIPSE